MMIKRLAIEGSYDCLHLTRVPEAATQRGQLLDAVLHEHQHRVFVAEIATAAAGAKKVQWHLIYNAGTTYSLTINRPAATTLCTLAPGQSCHVVFSGTAWTVVHAPAGSSSLQGASAFKSVETTGTGAPQTVAHGLGSTPVLFYAVPSNLTGGAYVVSAESADATNVTLTVTLGEKFKVVAFK